MFQNYENTTHGISIFNDVIKELQIGAKLEVCLQNQNAWQDVGWDVLLHFPVDAGVMGVAPVPAPPQPHGSQ